MRVCLSWQSVDKEVGSAPRFGGRNVAIADRILTGSGTFEELLRVPPDQLNRWDIATMNLLCVTGLPGAEDMDMPKYLRRLDALADFVRQQTAHDLADFRRDPTPWHVPKSYNESRFRIGLLVTYLKRDCGLHFNPRYIGNQADRVAPDWRNSKDLFINGLLSDERIGTCNSIPVLVAAIGRRLGYPLVLSANRHHVWARWVSPDGGERFNIEASNPAGFTEHADDYYRTFPHPMPPTDIKSGYYLRDFSPADDLALFLFSRAWVLEANQRFEESLPAWARCCFLAQRNRCTRDELTPSPSKPCTCESSARAFRPVQMADTRATQTSAISATFFQPKSLQSSHRSAPIITKCAPSRAMPFSPTRPPAKPIPRIPTMPPTASDITNDCKLWALRRMAGRSPG